MRLEGKEPFNDQIMKPEIAFQEIAEDFSLQYDYVTPGKMMSSDGLCSILNRQPMKIKN